MSKGKIPDAYRWVIQYRDGDGIWTIHYFKTQRGAQRKYDAAKANGWQLGSPNGPTDTRKEMNHE